MHILRLNYEGKQTIVVVLRTLSKSGQNYSKSLSQVPTYFDVGSHNLAPFNLL